MKKSEKGIGLISVTSLVVGNMIGSGIFLLPAALASFGSISILGWFLSGAGAIFLALVFSRLSREVPISGGPYAYPRMAFGDLIGFLSGWGYLISVWSANASIVIALVSYLSVFAPSLLGKPVVNAVLAITFVWLFTAINLRGVKAGARVQVVTTALKILPLVILTLIGVFYMQAENFEPVNSSDQGYLGAITSSAALTLFAFLGVESGTIPAQTVRNPKKVIPRATILGTVVTLLLYVLSTVVVFGLVGMEDLISSNAPFSEAAGIIFGPTGNILVAFGAVASTAGALNGWTLIQGQMPKAMSDDAMLPASFSKENKSGAPVFGLVIGSIIVTVLISFNFSKGLVGMFTFMLLLSTFTCLIAYLFSSLSEPMIVIKRKEPLKFSHLKKPLLVGIPAFLYSIWMIYGAGAEIVLNGLIMLLLGIPIYMWSVYKKKNAQQ